METRKIGSLTVSIVGLGCNNFGWRLDYDRTVAGDRRGAGGRHQLPRYRGHLRRHRERGVPRPGPRGAARPGGARHQIRHEGGRAAPGRQARLRAAGLRGQPAPAPHRPHRSLPAPPARPLDAHRATPSPRSTSWCAPARCARSAARTSRSSSSARRRRRRGRERDSSACRTNTACCTASRRRRCSPNASGRGSPSCPTSRSPAACSRGSTGAASRRPRTPAWRSRSRRGTPRFLNDRNLEIVEELAGFAASRGHSLLELAFSWLLSHRAGGVGDRRSHHPRAGAEQRQRRRLASQPGRSRRGGQAGEAGRRGVVRDAIDFQPWET